MHGFWNKQVEGLTLRCPAEGQQKCLALPPQAPSISGIQPVILQAQRNPWVNSKARRKTAYDSMTTFSDGRRSLTLTLWTHQVSPLSMPSPSCWASTQQVRANAHLSHLQQKQRENNWPAGSSGRWGICLQGFLETIIHEAFKSLKYSPNVSPAWDYWKSFNLCR